MYFCPNCNNVFNITKDSTQTGGENEISDNSETTISSVSLTDEEKFMSKLLSNDHITDKDINKISLDDLVQSTAYKKLKQKQKEIIYNKVQDLLPNDKKRLFNEKPNKNIEKAYFICNNCGYRKPIENGTLIFSKVSSDISQSYSPVQVENMKYSDILPRTRKYICPNTKCESHDDLTKREAVFFRLNNTFRIRHICQACDSVF